MLLALKALGLQDWSLIQEVRRQGNIKDLPPLNAPATDKEIHACLQSRGVKIATADNPSQREKETQLLAIGAVKWISCGMPQIEMGHKFAAALMVSNVSDEVLETVKRPWPAFMIVVPNDLIFISNPRNDNKPIAINRILVFEIANKHGEWAYLAWVNDMDLTVWRFGVNTKYLMAETIDPSVWGQDYVGSALSMTDLDERGSALIGRLIVTTCVSMTMPELMTPRNPKVHDQWKKAGNNILNLMKQNPGKEPASPVWNVGKPIMMDFRDRVREFSSGQRPGKSLEVRRMVMGHFKMQHHGTGRKERKKIWIEPYWRGPEEAAINVSSHVIKEPHEPNQS